MAAPTTVIPGNDFALSIGGAAIGASTNAALELELETPEVTNKDSANWQEMISGVRRHAYTFEGMYVVSGAEVGVGNPTASISIGGNALKGWDEATLEFACELHERANVTTGLDAAFSPKKRRVTLTLSGAYYDPAGTGATGHDALLDEVRGATTAGLAVVVAFGSSQSISFSARPSNVRIETPTGEDARWSVTLTSTGAVAVTDTNANAGWAALVTAWEASGASSSLTAELATSTTDATEFSSTAYVESLTVGLPWGQPVSTSGRLRGSGAIAVGTTS